MMDYDLTKSEGKPLYEVLYSCIKDDIFRGNLKPGQQVMSKRKLAEHLKVSVTTVENAYLQLGVEGYLSSQQGRGFFVNEIERPLVLGEQPYNPAKKLFQPVPEEAEEEFLIDFKANESSFSLFPFSTWSRLMRQVVSSQDPALLKTVPFNGIYILRKAIADYLLRFRGMHVDPAQIIVGAGTEYLYSRLLQLFGPENVFAIEDPGYKKFADISLHMGIVWDYIPIDEKGIRMDRLSKSQANVVHVSPANHFPTGIVMPISRRIDLLHWADEDPRRYIIEDDYDSELRYSGRPIPTLYEFDINDQVIYLNTFSKSLVPSLRISYMVLPVPLLERYKETMSFYSCTVSSFEQLTLASFISEGYFERHINRLKKHYHERRDLIMSAFRKSKLSQIATIVEADAGTHFLLRLNTRLSDEMIREEGKKRKMVLSLLSDYENMPRLSNSRTVIINYAGIDEGKIALALSILEDIFSDEIDT